MMGANTIAYFREEFSKIYPLSHVIWRTFEAARLAEFEFKNHVLDLGCGDASYSSIFFNSPVLNRPERIVGLDFDRKDCDRAEENGFYDKVVCAPSHEMPFPDQSFDMIFSNSVIEHIEKIDETIAECHRVLKPQGVFLFSAPNDLFSRRLWWYRFFRKIGLEKVGRKYIDFINGKNIFFHKNLYSEQAWQNKLGQAGFKILSTRSTLSRRAETLWDVFLPPSFAQHVFSKRTNYLPFKSINHCLAGYFIGTCLKPEEELTNGGNIIVLAQKT